MFGTFHRDRSCGSKGYVTRRFGQNRSVDARKVSAISKTPRREVDFVTHLPITLRPDPTRVVIKPFVPAEAPPGYVTLGNLRAQRIVDKVLAMDAQTVTAELKRVCDGLSARYNASDRVLMRRFVEVNGVIFAKCSVSDQRALLIGAYFSEEYAFEAVALFNPSIVAHPDQSGLANGATRFVLSLRAVGEGHLSSVSFRTGIIDAQNAVIVDPPSPLATVSRIEIVRHPAGDDQFVRLTSDERRDLSEVVLFPVTPAQRHGIEDVRLVRFSDDDGATGYYGTYTAFSGQEIRQELLATRDFISFDLHPLHGSATANKGMALFPRRIDGHYAMLGRQDHESIWFLQSDDLYRWDGGQRIITPTFPWEIVQLGNGGSPIELDEGWLVLVHGVGAVRNYSIGAFLLDKRDPTKVIGRTASPLIRPTSDERFGYVPNIAYSCGAMLHGRTLIMPYALADSITTFATIPIDQLLAALA